MKFLFLLFCSQIIVLSAFAQSNLPYQFDLGGSVTSMTYTVKSNQAFDFSIINLLPPGKGHYSIVESTATTLITPLPLPTNAAVTEKAVVPEDTCIADNVAKLAGVKSEVDLGKLMADTKVSCASFYKSYYPVTTYSQHVSGLKNETLTITVTNTDTKLTWTLTFQTVNDGQFLTLYGFTFIPHIFDKPHTFYAQRVIGKTNSYKIKQGNNESIADYAATVSFNYITNTSHSLQGSLTAGIGAAFNSSDDSGISPVVLLGYSFLYNQNLGFNFGIASDLVNSLSGQYHEGETIKTNLESSDLTQKSLGFNPFFSVIFRFGSSPFAAKSPGTPVVTDTNPAN